MDIGIENTPGFPHSILQANPPSLDPALFFNNLKALAQFHPDLAQQITEMPDTPALSLKGDASSGYELLCNYQNGDARPYYGDQSARELSRELIGRLQLKNPRILIFLGLGLGYHLIDYAHHPHPLNEEIIVIEPLPDVFRKALQIQDLTPIFNNPNVSFFVGTNLKALSSHLGCFFSQRGRLRYANAIEYIPLPPAYEFSGSFFQAVQQILPEAIGHQFNRFFGDPYDAYLGAQNVVANCDCLLNMPALDQARDLFKGRPGIVIASGPSLTDALPILQQLGNRAVTAACPSALPTLIKNEVHPDIWINIERLEEQGRFFEDLDAHPPHVFVGTPLVHPRCFTGNGGSNAFIQADGLWSQWLPLVGEIADLGNSSAHAVFQILQRLGCDPIYLVGQDLSYANGASHADDVWQDSQQAMQNLQGAKQKKIELQGNKGGPVQSNLFWQGYLKTFSERLIPRHEGKVYNVIAKDKGAKIPGAERMDPAMLLTHLPEASFSACQELKNRLQTTEPERQAAIKDQWRQKIETAIPALQRLVKEDRAFALGAKAFQFSQPIIMKRWDEAQAPYRDFLARLETHSKRYDRNSDYTAERETYHHFMRPLVQGQTLRYLIEFFSNATDLQGDFSEISRKLEIVFHMNKDEAYWAELGLELLYELQDQLSA